MRRRFATTQIEADVLPSLNADDLKDIGVTLVGHRRRLLDAIAALKPQVTSTADPAAAAELSSSSSVGGRPTIY